MRAGRIWRLAAVAATLAVASACGDGGTEPGSPAAAIVPLSLAADSVVIGEAVDPPLSVRVEDALGNPIEGAPVRFALVSGAGTLTPEVAVSGIEGIAEARFTASTLPGSATIRADVPSSPNVEPIDFSVVGRPPDRVLLSIVEGDDQRAEAGTQLPLPFAVRAETPGDRPAGGVTIEFALARDAGPSAVFTAPTFVTGADGSASTLLTLGPAAGEYEVLAYATGVESDTLRFRATATATWDGAVALDSVSAGVLLGGEETVLYGVGFAPDPAGNEVRIEGEPAEVLSVGEGEIRIIVPRFTDVCAPEREVGVRVFAADEASNGRLVPLIPSGTRLTLEPGESTTVRGADAVSCLQLGGGPVDRQYLLGVSTADRRPTRSADLRIRTRTHGSLANPPAVSLAPPEIEAGVEQEAISRARADGALRRSALDALDDASAGVPRPAPRRAAAVPVVGDALGFSFAVGPDRVASCGVVGAPIEATVRAVGRHLVLAEDVTAPAGGFGAPAWERLLAELDGIVAPADTAMFGSPSDIDGNGRVILLFTPRVNALEQPGTARVGGFFLPIDLAATDGEDALTNTTRGACGASNQAEIIYLAVADPDGAAGPARTVEQAIAEARGTTAHELQHLINASSRVSRAGFGSVEVVWLDESLSAVAEELAGLAVAGHTSGANLAFAQVADSRETEATFLAYHLDNFLGLALYMSEPSSPLAAGEPDQAGLVGKGFGWAMLRWIADMGASGPRAIFRDLVGGGANLDRGIENLERVAGAEWTRLVTGAAVAIALDDGGVEGVDPAHAIRSWDVPDILASLTRTRRGIFPQAAARAPALLGAETEAVEFDVRASSVRYFALAPGTDPMSISLSTSDGTRLSVTSEPIITIVRNR